MATLTRAQILTRIRRLSDTENDNHITDTDIQEWINESLAEFYDLLIQHQGPEYFARFYYDTATKPGTGVEKVHHINIDTTNVDQGIHSILGCDVGDAIETDPDFVEPGAPYTSWFSTLVQGKRLSNPRPIRPFTLYDREAGFLGRDIRYRVFGSWEAYSAGGTVTGHTQKWFISFEPWEEDIPFRLIYVPRCPLLTDNTVTFEFFAGWDEYITVDGAIKAYIRQERDPSLLMLRKEGIRERIAATAVRLNAEPETVTDVHQYDWSGWGEDYYDFWRGR